MAELVRNFSNLSLEKSRAIIEDITTRTYIMVWKDSDIRRVLDHKKTTKEKVLILLYAEGEAVSVANLLKWTEYSNTTNFRTKILKALHQEALIHFDEKSSAVTLLPPGIKFVEDGNHLELKI